MSYLNTPRLVFTGDFQADVNTVNNDVRHYYNPAFTENNWVQAPSGEGGWWNPDGGSTFSLVNCEVTQASYPDGTESNRAETDSVIGLKVAGYPGEASAKIVDLDPQFQFTSQLWALKICIIGSNEEVLLSGRVEPSGFKDMQFRINPDENPSGQPMGASWTSVMTDLEWGENARESRILSELMDRSAETGMLACNLTSFGYYKIIGGERFSLGRLLGAIGPYEKGDPTWFAPARRLIGLDNKYAFDPIGTPPKDFWVKFSFSNSWFDQDTNRLSVDLGGSFPLAHPTGVPLDVGKLLIGVVRENGLRKNLDAAAAPDYFCTSKDDLVKIGRIEYSEDWLMQTAGISDFTVSGEALKLIGDHQIVLFEETDDDKYKVWACETKDGLSVRADNNVRRIDSKYDGPVQFDFHIRSYQWGQPLPGAVIHFKRYEPHELVDDPSTCKTLTVPDGIDPISGEVLEPCPCWPEDAVLLNRGITTHLISDEQGVATVKVSVFDPDNPRGYIDGQIYLIGYEMEGLPTEQQYNLTFIGMWLMDALIMHVRNPFEVNPNPTWSDISEFMTQYRNLYPIMSRNLLDLGDPEQIAARRSIMEYAFSRDINDPTYMPVTRDLSEGKRKTVLNWLKTGMKVSNDPQAPSNALPENPVVASSGKPPTFRKKLNVKTKDDFSNI